MGLLLEDGVHTGQRVEATPTPHPFRVIGLVVVAVAALIGVFLLLGAYTGRPFSYFAKEPAEIFVAPKYVGAFAHTLVLMWAAAASAALLAGTHHLLSGNRRVAAFHLSAGGLSLILLADDFFMLHESLYLRLGMSQEVVYAIYVVLAGAFVLGFWGDLLARRLVPLIGVAGVFFAVSVGLDIVVPVPETVHVLEDGTKAFGVALWSAAIVLAAFADLRPAPQR